VTSSAFRSAASSRVILAAKALGWADTDHQGARPSLGVCLHICCPPEPTAMKARIGGDRGVRDNGEPHRKLLWDPTSKLTRAAAIWAHRPRPPRRSATRRGSRPPGGEQQPWTGPASSRLSDFASARTDDESRVALRGVLRQLSSHTPQRRLHVMQFTALLLFHGRLSPSSSSLRSPRAARLRTSDGPFGVRPLCFPGLPEGAPPGMQGTHSVGAPGAPASWRTSRQEKAAHDKERRS
jgi:hypothetical protein